MPSLSLPPITETFERHGLDGKALLRALDEYLSMAYELRAGIDPMADPFFFLQENDKIQVIEAFHGFTQGNSSLYGYDLDLPDGDEGGNGDDFDDEDDE